MNGACKDAGQAVGCGGPYIFQPTIIVQSPNNTTNCESSGPGGGCGVTSFAAPGAAAAGSTSPQSAPGGPSGSLLSPFGNLLPGLLGPAPSQSQATPSPSPSQDAVSGLLNYLLGH
jgi:hypothetical protein